MDETNIGLKKKKVVQEAEWIACPDYKTVDSDRPWYRKLFSTEDEKNVCIHARYCENWQYSELKKGCAAGYWNWYDVDIKD